MSGHSSSLVVTPELEQRIQTVERQMIAEHGHRHVLDAENRLRYFRNEEDARVHRRLEAERRVRAADRRREQQERRLEAARAESLAAMAQRGPTAGECAVRQRAENARLGIPLSTGYEA